MEGQGGSVTTPSDKDEQAKEFETYLRGLDREALEECAIMLSRDCTRLRRELDDRDGVIR